MKPAPSDHAEQYGSTRTGGVRHWGWDLPGAAGSAVVAPEDGVVVEAVSNGSARTIKLAPPWDGYGPGVVLLRGASGVWHLLAHVKPFVATGQKVREGDAVAAMTAGVGLAGPHVHWEVRVKQAHDSPSTRERNTQDPQAWLDGDHPIWDQVKDTVTTVARNAVNRKIQSGMLLVLLLLFMSQRKR